MLVTGIALVVAVVHLAFPRAEIDAVTVALLALAVLPWLGELVESLEGPGGWKVKYRELKREFNAVKGDVTELKETTDVAAEERQDESGAFARSDATPQHVSESATSTAADELQTLCSRYNEIRSTQRASGQRTSNMTGVVQRMIALAPQLDAFDWTRNLYAADRGERLAAYAYLYARPDPAAARPLLESVTKVEDKPFGQYWGIKAMRQVLPRADQETKRVARPTLQAFARSFRPGTDRHQEVMRLLEELGNEPDE